VVLGFFLRRVCLEPVEWAANVPGAGGGKKGRGKGTSLNSASIAPKPVASNAYVRGLEAPRPRKRSISVTSLRQVSFGKEEETRTLKPFAETLRVRIPPGKAGPAARSESCVVVG